MPFTPAHVMAVLPGVRWHDRLRLDTTCLVIGSMAPDFEYFVRGEQVSRISHTLLGLVVFDIPATLILAALWHALVKAHVRAVLPAGNVGAMLQRPWRPRWTAWTVASVVLSAVTGTFTHLAWDGVTHASGAGPRLFPQLTTVYEVPVVGAMALHRILQHTSTVVGLAVVTFSLLRAVRRAPPSAVIDDRPRTRARLVLVACVTVGLGAMAVRLHRMHIADPGSLISGAIAGVLAGLLVASVITFRRA